MGSIYRLVQRLALVAILAFAGSLLSASVAFADDDDGIQQPLPSPLMISPECKLGAGVFQLPTGSVDARNPLAVVGKSSKEILSREFTSDDFVQIPYQDTSPEQVAIFAPGYFETLRSPAAKAVLAMIDAARDQNVLLAVHSGFRAYATQCGVFNHKMRQEFIANRKLTAGNKADETAVVLDVNTRSAFPGESEHQLGTALDIVTNIPGMGWKLEPEMDQTPAFAWLQQNAYKFGFILSFPRGPNGPKAVNPQTGYVYEPWHWRYVGVVPAGRYQACKATMTTNEFLRALNANPKFVCASPLPAAAAPVSSALAARPVTVNKLGPTPLPAGYAPPFNVR